jgi:hypothetical protein
VQHDRPTAPELVEAVREFLEAEVLPALDDHRLKFRTLVAINGLGIAQRELEAGAAGPTLTRAELADLARQIRSGEIPPGALELLKEHVAAKLRVSNPRRLEKYTL